MGTSEIIAWSLVAVLVIALVIMLAFLIWVNADNTSMEKRLDQQREWRIEAEESEQESKDKAALATKALRTLLEATGTTRVRLAFGKSDNRLEYLVLEQGPGHTPTQVELRLTPKPDPWEKL
jgi:hypothetical protein